MEADKAEPQREEKVLRLPSGRPSSKPNSKTPIEAQLKGSIEAQI